MGPIDFILNLAGLLMWFNWRTARFDPLAGSTPATLAGTLRRASKSPFNFWMLPLAIVSLLIIRALFYWLIGGAIGWVGAVNVGLVAIPFRCDSSWASLLRVLLYSSYSYATALMAFHLWLLLISILKSATVETDSLRALLRVLLGPIEGWSRLRKLFLPLLVIPPLWWIASWPLLWLDLLPDPGWQNRIEQALLVGVGSYLCWKFLLAGVLGLYFVSSYVYFGPHPFWQHLATIGQQLLTPFRWLPGRFGKLDFRALLLLVIVLLIGHCAENGLKTARRFDARGKELPRQLDIPGLVDLYRHISK